MAEVRKEQAEINGVHLLNRFWGHEEDLGRIELRAKVTFCDCLNEISHSAHCLLWLCMKIDH